MPSVRANELRRIQASVLDPVLTDKEARRVALRNKSISRCGKWPNTLEAMRKKKDDWKKNKEALEENQRLTIDASELRLQQIARLGQIQRANALLYDQTDKMKTLRSKQLQSDVLEVHFYNSFLNLFFIFNFLFYRIECNRLKKKIS